MTSTMTSDATPEQATRPLLARVVGVLFAPRATFAAVAARPHWFGALALVAIVSAAGASAFMSTEVGKTAWVDAAVRQQEAFGRTLTDEQYRRLEQMATYAPYFGAASIVVLPIAAAALAAVF